MEIYWILQKKKKKKKNLKDKKNKIFKNDHLTYDMKNEKKSFVNTFFYSRSFLSKYRIIKYPWQNCDIIKPNNNSLLIIL